MSFSREMLYPGFLQFWRGKTFLNGGFNISYGSLIVKEQVMGEGKGSAKWQCLCDCGNSCVAAANLKSGRTRSCG